MSVRSVCVGMAGVCLASGMALSETYYVDGNIGNDAWDGTDWTTARATIGAGGSLLSAGDVLHVRGDCLYREKFTVAVSGTSWENMTVYQGVPGTNSGALPIITGGTDLDEAAFELVPGYQYVYVSDLAAVTYYRIWEQTGADTWLEYTIADGATLEERLDYMEANPGSFRIDNTEHKAYVHTTGSTHPMNFVLEIASSGDIVGLSGRSFVKITGFHVRHTLGDGVSLYNAQNCEVCENVIYGVTRGGVGSVQYPGGDNCRVHSNVLRDNGNAIWLRSARDCEVYSNTMYGNANVLLTTWLNDIPCTNIRFYANTIYSNSSVGDLNYAVDLAVWNNLIYENSARGFYVYRNNDNALFFNNTFYNNASYAMRFRTSTNATVFNNIVWPAAGGSGLYVDTGGTNGFRSDYNCIHSPGANAGYWATSYSSTLADWQTASGQDGNSLEQDPDFVSTTAGAVNFLINDDSPCRDGGTDLFRDVAAPSTDIVGELRPRNARTDIGAYEASVPAGTLFIVR